MIQVVSVHAIGILVGVYRHGERFEISLKHRHKRCNLGQFQQAEPVCHPDHLTPPAALGPWHAIAGTARGLFRQIRHAIRPETVVHAQPQPQHHFADSIILPKAQGALAVFVEAKTAGPQQLCRGTVRKGIAR